MKIRKRATLHLLDVLVTQHAMWTAKRIRRGLFGQSLVDFSSASWSSIQLQESAKCNASQQKRTQPKRTPRLLRSFAQSRVVAAKKHNTQRLLPGMSQYSDGKDGSRRESLKNSIFFLKLLVLRSPWMCLSKLSCYQAGFLLSLHCWKTTSVP